MENNSAESAAFKARQANEGKIRHCSDCGLTLPWGEWIRIQCTLGQYESKYFCYVCFVQRMTRYLAVQIERWVPK